MTAIEAIRAWLMTCPQVAGEAFGLNHLGAEPLEFAIIEAPTTPILKHYMDGSTLRRKVFALSAVQDYSPDVLQNLAASGLWEDITLWVETQNRARNFPLLGDGFVCRRVEVTATHTLLQTTSTTGRYQLQLAITYYQKGARR